MKELRRIRREQYEKTKNMTMNEELEFLIKESAEAYKDFGIEIPADHYDALKEYDTSFPDTPPMVVAEEETEYKP